MPKFNFEIVILAGGLSSRMGRDKSRIRIGRRTMLGHIRALAAQLNLPVRVLRRDAVPRCGPIGGIYTALARTRAHAILFLACDMPFVTPTFLNQMLRTFRSFNSSQPKRVTKSLRRKSAPPLPKGPLSAERSSLMGQLTSGGLGKPLGWGEGKGTINQPTIFSSHKTLLGLPCLIHRDSLPLIAREIAQSHFSLQSLAKTLKAKPLTPARRPDLQLLNLNTPADLKTAQRLSRSAAFTPLQRQK